MKNARIILPILTLAAAASFYYAWQNTPQVRRVANDHNNVRSATVHIADNTAENSRLNFGGGEQPKFNRPHRNLFGALFPPPAPVKPKVVVKPVRAVVPQVKTPPPPPPVVVRSSSSQMPSFKILGFLDKSDQLTAFVSLQGEIYLVKNEQLIADEYRVAALNHETITIARIKGTGQVSLPLRQAAKGVSGLPRGPVPGSAIRSRMPAVHPQFGN